MSIAAAVEVGVTGVSSFASTGRTKVGFWGKPTLVARVMDVDPPFRIPPWQL